MNADTIEAGRQLDELIAIKVLGFEKHEGWDENSVGQRVDDTHFIRFDDNDIVVEYQAWELPHYSTDIAAAWLVLEALAFYCELGKSTKEKNWIKIFADKGSLRIIEAEADTMPLAICRAALKAVEAK